MIADDTKQMNTIENRLMDIVYKSMNSAVFSSLVHIGLVNKYAFSSRQ